MTEERPDPPDHRLTRRQTLGIAGAAGTAVGLGGGAGKLISHLAEDPDEVTAASAAKSCKLTREVTEGPSTSHSIESARTSPKAGPECP